MKARVQMAISNRDILKSAKKHYALKNDTLSDSRFGSVARLGLVRDLRVIMQNVENTTMPNFNTPRLETAKKWNVSRNALVTFLRSIKPYITTDKLKSYVSKTIREIGNLNLMIAKDVNVREWNKKENVKEWNRAIFDLWQTLDVIASWLPYGKQFNY